MDVVQAASFLQTITYEPGFLDGEDFPRTEQPVWVLGKQYSALYDLEEIYTDVTSRLWFTYRKGFQPIGGVGPTSDAGWGCMLRCGQMMMAQALIMRSLGRDWRWQPNTYCPKYFEILRRFLDKKSSCYSIHQIASMGETEGKSVGEWFGPNTVAQVFRKLAAYDEFSEIAVHVAMDNTVIIEDIETLCRLPNSRIRRVRIPKRQHYHQRQKSFPKSNRQTPESDTETPARLYPELSALEVTDSDTSSTSSYENGLHAASDPSVLDGCTEEELNQEYWRHLLLFIPLRLGLTEMNLVYADALKACFRLPQSVGMIGGEPNHAHWFIGYVEDELIFLDPHTVQPVVDVHQEADNSFHCRRFSRIGFQGLDPSVALGFYCHDEHDFREFCKFVKKIFYNDQYTAMFEICQKRPSHWPPFQPFVPDASSFTDFTLVDRKYDSDEEFELL